jgi:hypothetical protein
MGREISRALKEERRYRGRSIQEKARGNRTRITTSVNRT